MSSNRSAPGSSVPDHKRIGILYLFAITVFFVLGSIAAGLIRLALIVPDGEIFTNDVYNRLFTLHGVIMVWFFLVPSIPNTLGNFLLPLMIGAKDVAFPRLNLLSWYIFVLGSLFTVFVMIWGGVDTGWTFYTPLSTEYSNSYVIMAVLGVIIVGFSSILTGMNFMVTVHKLRAPGMTWFRMPLFVWSLYATSMILVLATPVLTIVLILLFADRAFGLSVFDPAHGGDPVMFQHLFWFYSHPVVYVMVLPGMGVMSELVTAFSYKKIFGYKFIAFSSLAIAAIGFFVWGHHMFYNGMSVYASLTFSLMSFIVAVPSAIKVYNWAATIHKGEIRLDTPMLYAMGWIGLFVIGGVTGLMLASTSLGRPGARHLFRRRALPLHHGRRHRRRLPGRHTFLVAEDHRPPVLGTLGPRFRAADVPRIQHDILPAICAGLYGHAAALSCLSASIPGA